MSGQSVIIRHLNGLMRNRLVLAAVGLCLVLCFALCTNSIQTRSIAQRNTAQLNEMSNQLLRRVELAIDYALVTLGEQLENGITICGDNGVMAAKNVVLKRGLLKDIEVLREPYHSSCSVSGQEIGAIDEFLERYPAKNANISLQVLNKSEDGLVRVRWKQDGDLTLAAILNFDSLLFDVFPPALREQSSVRIKLGGIRSVAKYGNVQANGNLIDAQRFDVASQRFPVAVELLASQAELAQWNKGDHLLGYGSGTIIGALFALAIFVHFSRPANKIDELELAIIRGEIKPYFQPTFSLADRSIVGCEVLVRWVKPDGTMIPPDRFIPLAESVGLIVPMTERLFVDSFALLKPIIAKRKCFKIAFNVTPDHFVMPDFLSKLSAFAHDAGVAHELIVIELTERQSLEDASLVAKFAHEARRLGYRIALDDTGSGHNGLAHIQDVPLDIIKIDKRFVDLVGVNAVATSIIHMLVRLASDIGASTVAEGIETELQLQRLVDSGVSDGQGYLVAPALQIQAFEALLAAVKPIASDVPMLHAKAA
jgi:c-di-GMP phosphodiesterase